MWCVFNGICHCCCPLHKSCPTVIPSTAASQASLSFTISQSLLKLKSIESVMASNHLILCHPLLLLPSVFHSIRVSSSIFFQVAKVFDIQLLHWSFQWIFRTEFPLELTSLISMQSKELSRVFYSTTVQKHQFFGTQSSLCPVLMSTHDYWKNHIFDETDLCWQSDVSTL